LFDLLRYHERVEAIQAKSEELKKSRDGLAADAGREAITNANFEIVMQK
jgi:hypothetical protein